MPIGLDARTSSLIRDGAGDQFALLYVSLEQHQILQSLFVSFLLGSHSHPCFSPYDRLQFMSPALYNYILPFVCDVSCL